MIGRYIAKVQRIRESMLESKIVRKMKCLKQKTSAPDPKTTKQILVILKLGLGNFILFIPLLRNLREHFSNTEIVILWMERGMEAKSLMPPGLVDRIIEYNSKDGATPNIDLIRFCKKHRLNPDLAIVRMTNYPLISKVVAILNPPWRIGHLSGAGFAGKYDLIYNYGVPLQDGKHEVELNLDLLRAIDVPIIYREPVIEIDAAYKKRADSFLAENGVDKKFICIQVGTSLLQPWKRWSIERWSILIQNLLLSGYNVVLLGSKDEREHLECLQIMSISDGPPRLINAAGLLSFKESAALLSRCEVFISCDSSLMHVAASMGIPQVALWGPTQHERTRPLSDKCLVIRNKCECNGSLFDKNIVNRIWSCGQKCMEIGVQDVLKAVSAILPIQASIPNGQSFWPDNIEPVCPICDSSNASVLFIYDFSKWKYNCKTFLCRCGECKIIFNWPRPTSENISSFYGPGYYVFKRDDIDSFKRAILTYVRTVKLVEGLVSSRKVLDVGSAGGHLLALLKQLGWEVTGVEISRAASEQSIKQWNIGVFNGSIHEFSKNRMTFPLVTAIDVLEHVPDPVPFIRAIRNVCEPNGYLVIDTPNGKSFHYKIFGAAWRGFNPFHIQLFDIDNVTSLLESNGFEFLKAFTYNNAFPKGQDGGIKLVPLEGQALLPLVAKKARNHLDFFYSSDYKSPLLNGHQGENLVVFARRREV